MATDDSLRRGASQGLHCTTATRAHTRDAPPQKGRSDPRSLSQCASKIHASIPSMAFLPASRRPPDPLGGYPTFLPVPVGRCRFPASRPRGRVGRVTCPYLKAGESEIERRTPDPAPPRRKKENPERINARVRSVGLVPALSLRPGSRACQRPRTHLQRKSHRMTHHERLLTLAARQSDALPTHAPRTPCVFGLVRLGADFRAPLLAAVPIRHHVEAPR